MTITTKKIAVSAVAINVLNDLEKRQKNRHRSHRRLCLNTSYGDNDAVGRISSLFVALHSGSPESLRIHLRRRCGGLPHDLNGNGIMPTFRSSLVRYCVHL